MSEHILTLAPRPCPHEGCELGGTMEPNAEYATTCVGYSEPHDGNCISTTFRCPDGHRFYATSNYVCSCGWSGVKECRISGHHRRTPIHAYARNAKDLDAIKMAHEAQEKSERAFKWTDRAALIRPQRSHPHDRPDPPPGR